MNYSPKQQARIDAINAALALRAHEYCVPTAKGLIEDAKLIEVYINGKE